MSREFELVEYDLGMTGYSVIPCYDFTTYDGELYNEALTWCFASRIIPEENYNNDGLYVISFTCGEDATKFRMFWG